MKITEGLDGVSGSLNFLKGDNVRKIVNVSANWDAESCKFTEYKVEGTENIPIEVKLKDYRFPSTLKVNEKGNWVITTESNIEVRHAIGIWNDVNNSGDIFVNGVRLPPGIGWLAWTNYDFKEFTFRGDIQIPREGNYKIVITGGYYDGKCNWTDSTFVYVNVQSPQPPIPQIPYNVLLVAVIALLAGVLIAKERR